MDLNLSKLSILVVDDIKVMRSIIINVLKTLGVGHVYDAEDAASAFKVYCEKKPDIIITDWHMPQVTGIDLVRSIRKNPKSHQPSIPIIMMTGYNDLSRIAEARDCGITEFIVKPFSAEDIAKRITHIIKNPRDFIKSNGYTGPDRRRRDDKGKSAQQRRKDDRFKIRMDNNLQMKVGIGALNPKIIKRSQQVIDENNVDFAPIANSFIKQLEATINNYQSGNKNLDSTALEITDIVMQIKGNATTFHYQLMGQLANIMLQFLESLKEVDEDAIEIVIACYKTLRLITAKKMRGAGGDLGDALTQELKAACDRYHKSRNEKVEVVEI